VPGEALETMVELCLWPFIVPLRKLAIYCSYLVHTHPKKWAGLNLHVYLVSRCVEERNQEGMKTNFMKAPSEKSRVFV
jgi:hypothetical protein